MLLATGGMLVVLPGTHANEILPGGAGAPDVFALGYSYDPPGGPSAVRTIVSTKQGTWGSPGFSGSFYEQVDADPNNVFCAGCLDFIFQVSNDFNSTQNLTGVTESGFSGFHTDVGYDSISVGSANLCGIDDNGFCTSGRSSTLPITVTRSADGNVVGFNFGGVLPGDSTVDLVIETDARSFVDPPASFTGSNGGTGTALISGPAGPSGIAGSTVPEPASLFGLFGMAAAAFLRRGRRR